MTTLSTRLAACLQEAGMACPSCKGYKVVTPEVAAALRGEDASESFPILGCDVCDDPTCQRNRAVMETCPTCHGEGVAPEFAQVADYADEERRVEA